MDPGDAPATTVVLPHGTTVTYDAAGRRLLERDRHGHPLARLTWRDDGTLAAAAVRLPDGSWLAIEPGAVIDAPWGRSDRLWHHDTPLTIFAAVDYARIAFIPAVAEPGGWDGLVYYRLHGSPKVYYSNYDAAYLETLVATLTAAARRAETWCVFDNTADGWATANALDVLERVR